jgi:Lamin Tail Domain/Chitobiase/beta-hexosaminidase C-terminal domain/PA14 domain
MFLTKRLLCTFFVAVLYVFNASGQSGLVINEIMSNNSSFKTDEDGDNEDWIEIYNGSGADVNLLNYGLTDLSTNLGKWKFPNVTIPNGGYLTVWASSKNRKPGTDAPTLGIVNKRYENIRGSNLSSLISFTNYPENPDSRFVVTQMESPLGQMNTYGQEFYTLFTAPTTGNYVFAISGNDEAKLFVSSNSSPPSLTGTPTASIAASGSLYRVFNTNSSQTSAPIAMVAGQQYYIRAIHKADYDLIPGGAVNLGDTDHLTVRVTYPSGTTETPLVNNCTVPYTQLHTNFSISTTGETITLSNPAGLIVSTVNPVNLTKTNISYGASPNGSTTFSYFLTPTPAATNNATAYLGVLPSPTFSIPGGVFSTNQTVSITSSDPAATIVYSLDGSNPSSSAIGGINYDYKNSYLGSTGGPAPNTAPILNKQIKSFNYSGSLNFSNRSGVLLANDISNISSTLDLTASYLPSATEIISKGNVLRAIATKVNWIQSEPVTQNYFIFPNGASRYTLPIVSLNTHTPDWVGYQNGIFVPGKDYDDWKATVGTASNFNYIDANFNRDSYTSERRANFSYIKNGITTLNQEIGIRIQGDASRQISIKTIRLYPRTEYGGPGSFNIPFFPNDNTASFRRIFIRNSSQDYNLTLLRDGLIQTSVNHLNFTTQKYTPVISFINGEYFGLMDLRERNRYQIY